MEYLRHELISLLTDLSDDTHISIRAFSSPGYQNHASGEKHPWCWSSSEAVEQENPRSPLSTLLMMAMPADGGGGTQPWEGLDEAFADGEPDTLYFLLDGEPNNNRNGGSWNTSDHTNTPDYYINLNCKRNISL